MESTISKLKTRVNSIVQENWNEEFVLDVSQNTTYDDLTSRFIEKREKAIREIFCFLNVSLLEGEYFSQPSFQNALDEVGRDFQKITGPDSKDNNSQLFVLNQFQAGFYNPIETALYFYNRFCRNLKIKYESSHQKTFNIIIPHRFYRPDNNLLLNTFLLNIRVAELDHFPAFSDSSLRTHIEIHEDLIRIKDNPQYPMDYLDLIVAKNNFLITKLIHLQRRKKAGKTLVYEVGFEQKELKIDYFKSDLFDGLHNKLKIYYEFEDGWRQELITLRRKISSELMPFFEIQYYKDVESNKSKIREIIDSYAASIKSKKSKNEIDDNSDKLNINTFHNWEFSNSVANGHSLEEIEDKIDIISTMQQSTEIKNFHPFLKFSRFLEKEVEKNIKAQFTAEELSKINDLLRKLETAVKKTRENLDWCRENYFLPIRPPFNECCVKDSATGVNLYLASSFALPLDFEDWQEQVSKIEEKLDSHKSLLYFHRIFKEKIEKIDLIHEEQKKLPDEIKKNEYRSIEILSIFAAIVTFASGGIQLIQNPENHATAMLFLFTLGGALSFFILSIFLLTGSISFKKSKKKIIPPIKNITIGVLLFLPFICVLYLFFFQPEFSTPQKAEKQDTVFVKSKIDAPKPIVADSTKLDTIK